MRKTVNRKLIFGIIIAAIAIASILVTFFICVAFMRAGVGDEVDRHLSDVAEQNANAVNKKIEENYALLRNVEKELVAFEGEPKDNISKLKPLASALGLIRIAMCDADGNAYSTDGGHGDTNLSYRDFYIRGMAGKCTVTEILYDAMSDEHKPLNIISAPMYGDGENIEGVIGLTYYSTEFNAELQIKSFGGKGKSYAINEEGQVIVAPSTDGKDLA